jgi:hypothetical protein
MLKTLLLQDWRGLNRISDRLNMPPDFLYNLQNGYVKKDVKSNKGVITQRDGCTKFNSVTLDTGGYGTTTYIRNVFEAKWNAGGKDVIIRAGTAWGKYDNSDSFDTIDGARSDDVVGQCVMFKNELIMVDGGVPRKMTSAYAVADLSTDANMPQDSTAVWVHRDKVWLNSAAAPMKAYFSITNSASIGSAWTGATDAGTIDLSTVLPEGDTILGFRTYGGIDTGYIAIICRKYTVVYAAGSNTYDFTFVQYFPTTCLSMGACAYVGTDIVYPSRDSVTSIISSAKNQMLEINPLSKYIELLYRNLVGMAGATNELLMSGVFHKKLNHYYLTIPIANNCHTLVYSVDIGNFVGDWTYPFTVYSWCERIDGSLLAGGDGFVYTMNDGTDDDGTAITFNAQFPAMYFDEPMRYKKPIVLEALLFAENADPAISFDYWYGGVGEMTSDVISKSISLAAGSTLYYWDDATSLWDVALWASVAASYLYRTSDLVGRGRFMEMDIKHSTDDAKLTIAGLAIGYALEGAN